jgi:hypothetical protein
MIRGIAAAAVILVSGCAAVDAPFRAHLESASPQVRECAEWYRRLDERVAAAGVPDAQDARVPGFPYLRVSRLLAALRPAASNEYALQALADRMLELDLEARRYEIASLPPEQIPELRDANDRFGLRFTLQRTQECGRLLREIDLAKPASRATLLRGAGVADDHRPPQRIEDETLAAFRREPALPEGAGLVRYAPEPAGPLPRPETAAILRRAAQNPLGIPEPQENDLKVLLAAYAPSFEVELKGDYDRFGALRRLRGTGTAMVEGADLAVYVYPSWTIYEGKVLLQLVYTLWFPGRSAGKLDGITWRVTLAPDGEPLVYDAIHSGGGSHLFFPTPHMADGERPLLRIASGTHAIEQVGVTHGTDSLVRYALRPYGDLRSLPGFAGPRGSAFDAADLFERRFKFDLR